MKPTIRYEIYISKFTTDVTKSEDWTLAETAFTYEDAKKILDEERQYDFNRGDNGWSYMIRRTETEIVFLDDADVRGED